MGFSPEERDEAFVHKHRVLAHEALMRIDVAGIMGAWRAARAYARALLVNAGDSGNSFERSYKASAVAFARMYGSGLNPSEVIGTLVVLCDRESKAQGRLGASESFVSRENAGTGLIVGVGRLKREELALDETIVFDERTGRVLISESIKLHEEEDG